MKLTLDSVQKQHRQQFVLERTTLFSHGDLNPLEHIQKINELIRSIDIPAKGTPINKYSEQVADGLPRTITIEHLEPYSVFMLSYRLPANLPEEDSIRLQLLSYLLFDLPDSPFQKWLGFDVPYPKLYGMRGDTFNIGFCTPNESISKEEIIHERTILDELTLIS